MKITKQKRVDKRIKISRFIKQNKQVLKAMLVLGILFALIFTPMVYKWLNPPMLSPLGTSIVPKVVEVIAQEKDYHADALTYIRHRGQELGFDDYTISKFIKVGRCESGFKLNQNAKNKSSTATGVFQIIIGTWDSNRCSGERWDFIDNIDCAYKLLKSRGFQPWNASKACWNK